MILRYLVEWDWALGVEEGAGFIFLLLTFSARLLTCVQTNSYSPVPTACLSLSAGVAVSDVDAARALENLASLVIL